MFLKYNFLIGSLGYARLRMAVTLKAIYYCGCESNEGRWDSRRDMIKGFCRSEYRLDDEGI